MNTKPTYYLEVDTYWQNSPSFFVGPFESRAAAEAWYKDRPENSNLTPSNQMSGDVRHGWRVYANALSKTDARKRGMRDDYEHGYNVLGVDIEPTADGLDTAKRNLVF